MDATLLEREAAFEVRESAGERRLEYMGHEEFAIELNIDPHVGEVEERRINDRMRGSASSGSTTVAREHRLR